MLGDAGTTKAAAESSEWDWPSKTRGPGVGYPTWTSIGY